MTPGAYIILECSDTADLQSQVRDHISKGWTPLGGPFTYSWAPGHGNIHAMPVYRQEQDPREGWIYLYICQAMTFEGDK